jgi:hypothetical protein
VYKKDRNGRAWLLAAVWQLKEVRQNADKEKCVLRLVEEDAEDTHIIELVRN